MKSINIIKGKSGSGKTTYILDKIKEIRKSDPFKRIIVVVPEQYSHNMERLLVDGSSDDQNKKGTVFTEVLSFSRLSHRIIGELGGRTETVLSEIGRSMLVRHIVDTDGKELKFFGANANMQGYIEEIKSFISELMQYDQSPERLEEIIEKLKADPKANGSLIARLTDILVIYKKYEDYLSTHKLITKDGLIDLATDSLERYSYEKTVLDNAVVFFDGFTGFEPLQYKFLRELLRRSDDIYVSITMDLTDVTGRSTRRLFTLSRNTEDSLRDMAEEMKLQLNVIPCQEGPDGIPVRFKNAPDLAALEAGLFRSKFKKFMDEPEHLHLSILRRPTDEIDMIISKIKELLRSDKKLRYSDIAVISGDHENYGIVAKSAFEKAGIPLFVDMSRELDQSPAVMYINALLDVISSDFEHRSVIKLLKSGFFIDISGISGNIDTLDNFILATGIRGISMWKRNWNMGRFSKEQEVGDMLNVLRQRVYEIIEPLYMSFKGKKTVREFNEILMNFLMSDKDKLGIEEAIDRKEEEFLLKKEDRYASELRQVWDDMNSIFDDMNNILGDSEVDLKEYICILRSGISAMSVSVIPPEDAVIFGDTSRTRIGNEKYIFMIGISDAFIPRSYGGGGIINDEEREKLTDIRLADGRKVGLAGTSLDRIDEDEFHLYMNITKADREVYISYPELGFDDKSMNPAYPITRIRAIFPNLKTVYEHSLNSVAADAPIETLFADPVDRLDPELLELLYTYIDDNGERKKSRLSISQLEKLASCPYKYFIMYGLRLKEREEHKVSFADIGDVLHASLDMLVKGMKERGKNWRDYDKDSKEFNEIAEKAFDFAISNYKNSRVYSTDRNEYLFSRYRKTFMRTAETILREMKVGNYDTLDGEISYNLTEPVSLRGFIDRVDIADGMKVVFDEDGAPSVQNARYVKVVDYKTGLHRVSIPDLYYGIQIQTVVYLRAAKEIVEDLTKKDTLVIPAGVFYYNINDSFRDIDKLTEDGFEIDIPDGIYDAAPASVKEYDESVIETDGGMPKDYLPSVKSKAINFATDKDGVIKSTCMDDAKTEEEMANILKYSDHKIGQLAAERDSGDISISPFVRYSDSATCVSDACLYCAYANICGINRGETKNTRIEYFKTDDEIYSMMVKELEEKCQENGTINNEES